MIGKIRKSTLLPLEITQVVSGGQAVTSGSVIFSQRASFSVTGPSSETLSFLVDDALKYTGKTSKDGIGFFLIDDIPEGRHEFRVTFEDDSTDAFLLISVVTKPFIKTLKDSNGDDIEHEGTTKDTRLVISGLAKEGQIKILNDSAPVVIATFTVERDRSWGGDLELQAGKTYALKARADDGKESNLYSVTVEPASGGEVDITSLTDSSGPVGDETATPDTNLSIAGTATSNSVEIFDNDDPTPITNFPVVGGNWGGELDLPVDKRYSLTAKAPGGQATEPRSFYVGTPKKPEITRVSPASGPDLEDGDTTTSTLLTFYGVAAGHFKLSIRDGDKGMANTSVYYKNDWTETLKALPPATYIFNVKPPSDDPSDNFTITIESVTDAKLAD